MRTVMANDALHNWFGLSYASYLVLPRSVMQAMPADWQERMVALLAECEDRLGHCYGANEYDVRLRVDGRYAHDPLANYRYPPADLVPDHEPVGAET